MYSITTKALLEVIQSSLVRISESPNEQVYEIYCTISLTEFIYIQHMQVMAGPLVETWPQFQGTFQMDLCNLIRKRCINQ